MFEQSLSYLEQNPNQFNLDQILISLCKKSTINSSSPEIDFLDFQQKLSEINSFHEKTCEDIVEFVDTHCSQYININSMFQSLQYKIQNVENIIKEVAIKLKDYGKIYYQDEGKIQEMISRYETSVLEKALLSRCKQQTEFLSRFVVFFESITSKPMQNLIFKQRALMMRFCYKFSYLHGIFNHHLLHQALPEYLTVLELFQNLSDEVEFYLSEQLSKLIKCKSNQHKLNKDPKLIALNEIKICYMHLNKLSQYYKNIEQNLIGRQLQIAQKNVITNKLNLIAGKNMEIVEQFFKTIFNSIKQFPKAYPRKRLLELIYAQLKKNQVKFLYTYTLPIFPTSYNYYMKLIDTLDGSEFQLITNLKKNHNWDLKRWADVREKNILDRCFKDWQKDRQKPEQNLRVPDLQKWIDIIFKQNCKIDGIKSNIAMLAIKVVTKYSYFLLNLDKFDSEWINKLIQIQGNIEKFITEKLVFFYDTNNKEDSHLFEVIKKISITCKQSLQKSINKLIQKNTKLLSKSCCGCFEPSKSFIMKIIKGSKELTQYGIINVNQNIFKPLSLYLQNNSALSQQSKKWIMKIVVKQIMKYYDEVYVPEIYQYGRANVSFEQLEDVMEIVSKERNILFVNYQEKLE